MKKRPFRGIILLLPILGWFLLALDNPNFHDPRLSREPIPAIRLNNKDYATMLEARGWPAGMLNTAADNDYQGRTGDIGHDGQGGL